MQTDVGDGANPLSHGEGQGEGLQTIDRAQPLAPALSHGRGGDPSRYMVCIQEHGLSLAGQRKLA
jgi:hypothetical protein